MLSPGQFYKRVPKDLKNNLLWRKKVIEKAAGDKVLQKALIEYCAQDIIWFINTFVWQYNPNADREVEPFITWDWQDLAFLGGHDEDGFKVHGILEAIADRRDLVIEKSREMGASWMCLLVMVWVSLFHPRKKFLCVSRDADSVDRIGDPDSLFWKIDFIHEHLPHWMLPPGGVVRKKMNIAYKKSHSVITGQASTGKAGVGGRCTAMFVDEFGLIDEDTQIYDSTADTTRCRIFNSTHYGTGTKFYQLTTNDGVRKLVIHWTMHPLKKLGLYRYDPERKGLDILDKDFRFPPDHKFVLDGTPSGGPFPGIRSYWYDLECGRGRSRRSIAEHLDIDPSGSLSQFFDPLITQQRIRAHARDPVWEGDVLYSRDSGELIQLVPRSGGPLKLWINLDADGKPEKALYGAGADTAAGVGTTPSCLSIGNHRGEKVAEFTDAFIKPEEFAALMCALCTLFASPSGEGAILAVEQQGPGSEAINRLLELGYRRLYYKVDDFGTKKIRSDKPGWYPKGAAQRLLLDEYRAALTTRQLINRSEKALLECNMFIFDGKDVKHSNEVKKDDPGGSTVNHGDHVIADALMWKMIKSWVQRAPKMPVHKTAPVGSLAWRWEKSQNELRERRWA